MVWCIRTVPVNDDWSTWNVLFDEKNWRLKIPMWCFLLIINTFGIRNLDRDTGFGLYIRRRVACVTHTHTKLWPRPAHPRIVQLSDHSWAEVTTQPKEKGQPWYRGVDTAPPLVLVNLSFNSSNVVPCNHALFTRLLYKPGRRPLLIYG